MSDTENTIKKTLYRVLLVGGNWITIDESPYVLRTEWADVRAYSLLSSPGGYNRYVDSHIFNIRPSMIVGFRMLEDCEVIV